MKDSPPQYQPFLKVLRRVWPSISDKPQASKRGFSEGGFGGALAGRADDDGGVDSRASDDGHVRLSEPSRVSPEEAWRGVDNIKN